MGDLLTKEQADLMGEVSNISIGNSATTLSVMVNQRVEITTPRVEVIDRATVLDDYEDRCVFVQVQYVKGLKGNNVLILKEQDVKILTDLMMGGMGMALEMEFGELHLSAVSEAMNQMIATAATAMAEMLKLEVDISTPQVNFIDVESIKVFERTFAAEDNPFVKVSFRLQVGDVIDSMMIQLYPLKLAYEIIDKFQIKKEEDKKAGKEA
jgi:flagellar motor switch protein FliN/FliY